MDGVLLFHLNLAFSSIEEASRRSVIDSCYRPLLNLASECNIKINIEATGYTLLEIAKIAPDWITKLKYLIADERVEFVGSGYCQIISPLVPAAVNKWNISHGTSIYQSILGVVPRYLLANEMAVSSSFVDLAAESGYFGVVLEKNNIENSLYHSQGRNISLDDYGRISGNAEGNIASVHWVDSLNFQKFQEVIHGKISIDEYLNYLAMQRDRGTLRCLSVYGSDGEVFNFRPGRFNDEGEIVGNEWQRIEVVLKAIQRDLGVNFALLTALEKSQSRVVIFPEYYSSAKCPISVKKQLYYNVTRWAVTGRSDGYINKICHWLLKRTELGDTADFQRMVCYYWSSDFRTHITLDRWTRLLLELQSIGAPGLYDETDVPRRFGAPPVDSHTTYENSAFRVTISPSWGNAITLLEFHNNGWIPVIKSFKLGEFRSIELAHQYISNSVSFESGKPNSGRLYKQNIKDILVSNNNGSFESSCVIDVDGQSFYSLLSGSERSGELDFRFIITRPISGDYTLRIFNLYFSNDFLNSEGIVYTHNGGTLLEQFVIGDNPIDHGSPCGRRTSAIGAFGATESCIYIEGVGGVLRFAWQNANYYMVPMLTQIVMASEKLIGLYFSISEIDDTSKDHIIPAGVVGLKIKYFDSMQTAIEGA